MRVFKIKRKLFGKYKEVETVRAANERNAFTRFTMQTLQPPSGRYAIFYQGNLKKEFKFKRNKKV